MVKSDYLEGRMNEKKLQIWEQPVFSWQSFLLNTEIIQKTLYLLHKIRADSNSWSYTKDQPNGCLRTRKRARGSVADLQIPPSHLDRDGDVSAPPQHQHPSHLLWIHHGANIPLPLCWFLRLPDGQKCWAVVLCWALWIWPLMSSKPLVNLPLSHKRGSFSVCLRFNHITWLEMRSW